MLTHSIRKHTRREQKFKLLEQEAFQLLEEYNIPYPPYGVAESPEETGKIAEKIGFPVVLKIISPDISHKTDVGGVVVGVETPEKAIEKSYLILENVKRNAPSARIRGILVQKMVPSGLEVIIGGIVDQAFGITLMLGLGGIFTEILRDVSFRIWPITLEEALEMINELKGSLLFKGYRGRPPINTYNIAEVILKLGKLMEEHPEIESVDFNPVVAYPDTVLVVDARFILKTSINE